VELIGHTTTAAGLRVQAKLDTAAVRDTPRGLWRRSRAAPSLVEAVRTREAEIARLRAELDDPDPANAPPNPRNRMSSHHGNLRPTLRRSESVRIHRGGPPLG